METPSQGSQLDGALSLCLSSLFARVSVSPAVKRLVCEVLLEFSALWSGGWGVPGSPVGLGSRVISQGSLP